MTLTLCKRHDTPTADAACERRRQLLCGQKMQLAKTKAYACAHRNYDIFLS